MPKGQRRTKKGPTWYIDENGNLHDSLSAAGNTATRASRAPPQGNASRRTKNTGEEKQSTSLAKELHKKQAENAQLRQSNNELAKKNNDLAAELHRIMTEEENERRLSVEDRTKKTNRIQELEEKVYREKKLRDELTAENECLRRVVRLQPQAVIKTSVADDNEAAGVELITENKRSKSRSKTGKRYIVVDLDSDDEDLGGQFHAEKVKRAEWAKKRARVDDADSEEDKK